MEQRNPFDAQLRVLAQRYNRISEFDVTFVNATVNDDINLERLSQNLCDDLSKATQEAVSNAVKHSEGDQIRIQFTVESNNLTLTVDDNGTGIDDVTIRKSGTRNMEQRVEKHQGLFFLENITTGGTRVIFQVDNIPLVTI
ncbi:MAG: ATP-binding protein [Acidimicrobiales bacterium]|nr:ATP-binding protein [Acidimicrobiales bacterium]